ncbi:hypothetical protein LOZ12_003768 [Ophidiomyces ophidiicola]|nr:hypothetical protein LOZ62_004828 [Ophidiomyces ophidiicola]KAI2048368.1 hypothetical protein LOZ38_004336 [Ophidiomyces ophidiicola]KAI2051170.1 hypothetical protein LOZ44_003233 [Ophidiomyces ophidiicola]KAI2073360.1 hypothetical protein LOZ39_004046 [Ophidiomyces ophidiicola]KAI2075594.1 hypothetical protein LOZ37_003508 [Ophidiomyces ophidiicola]
MDTRESESKSNMWKPEETKMLSMMGCVLERINLSKRYSWNARSGNIGRRIIGAQHSNGELNRISFLVALPDVVSVESFATHPAPLRNPPINALGESDSITGFAIRQEQERPKPQPIATNLIFFTLNNKVGGLPSTNQAYSLINPGWSVARSVTISEQKSVHYLKD